MKIELQETLYAKYPELFQRRTEPLTRSLMGFGLEVSDGWYNLIYEMCKHLAHLAELEASPVIFSQIKEKFGGLRAYTEGSTELQDIVINYYEDRSYRVCETCGDDGQIRNSKFWLRTLCDRHAHEEKYAISDDSAKHLGLAKGEYVSLEELRETAKTIRELT